MAHGDVMATGFDLVAGDFVGGVVQDRVVSEQGPIPEDGAGVDPDGPGQGFGELDPFGGFDHAGDGVPAEVGEGPGWSEGYGGIDLGAFAGFPVGQVGEVVMQGPGSAVIGGAGGGCACVSGGGLRLGMVVRGLLGGYVRAVLHSDREIE